MPENKFVDQVIMKLDGRYVVAVSKDHNKGLVVQVARMNPKHVRTDSGAAYEGHTPVIVWQEVVTYGDHNRNSNEIRFKDPAAIEAEFKSVVLRAHSVAQKSIATENAIDAMLVKFDQEVNKP